MPVYRARLQTSGRSSERPLKQPRIEITCSFPLPQTANWLAARRRGDGRQFRRKREAHIFIDQIEITLVRETKFGEPLADLFDEDFGSGCARGQADARNAFEPLHVNVPGRVNQL